MTLGGRYNFLTIPALTGQLVLVEGSPAVEYHSAVRRCVTTTGINDTRDLEQGDSTMKVASVVDKDFEERVLRSSTPVLVAFRASYCLPSQQLVPIINEIAVKFGERVRCVAVDAEGAAGRILKRYKVT